MKDALEKTEDGSIFSGDGRYPIRRNSSHCSFDVINIQSNKIVLGVVDKQPFYHPDETFTSTSNMLETTAMNRALDQVSSVKGKVYEFVIDGDNKNKAILEKEKYFIIRDPYHLILSFNHYLDNELKINKKMILGIPDCFRGLRDKIKKWYSNLLYMTISTEIKKTAWLNTIDHL